jgi:hypothetical protein
MPRRIALAAGTIIAALYVVGLVSGTILRHVVQTLPLWLVIVLAMRRSANAKWLALPMLVFWLVIMVLIWLFLLDWARVLRGHFTPTEIAMTIVIGVAAVGGIIFAVRERSATASLVCVELASVGLALQLAAMWLSTQPGIATR